MSSRPRPSRNPWRRRDFPSPPARRRSRAAAGRSPGPDRAPPTVPTAARPYRPAGDRRDARGLRPPRHAGAGRRERVLLALELQRLHRLDLDGVAHELVGRLPDQDLAGGRRLFQPGGDVDGVAGHQPLAGGDVARDDLAGIDPGAVLQADAVVLLEPFVDHLEGFAHLRGRPDRAQGVVLMQPWQSEDSHDRVADVLLDRPAMSDEDGTHPLEVDREDLAERLAVQALTQ